MPLKIFEKVSPFLKFRRPSSPVWVKPVPPLASPIRSGSALRIDQLAPTERDESSWPSISPMLKLTACAGAAVPRAMARVRRCGWKIPGLVVFVMRLSVNEGATDSTLPSG